MSRFNFSTANLLFSFDMTKCCVHFSYCNRVKNVNISPSRHLCSKFCKTQIAILCAVLPESILTDGISQNNDKTHQGYHKWHHHMGTVGYQAHEQKATTSDRGHHQQRRCALCEIAQSGKSYREYRGKHDGLEKIVAQQGQQ